MVINISSKKTLGRKLKLIKAKITATSSPRWADIKKFGLGKARFRSIKRFASRHWRRRGGLQI
ncbi:MAG: hypothetical protein ABIG84_03895 [archaeon]